MGKEGLAPTAIPRVMEVDANLLAEKLKKENKNEEYEEVRNPMRGKGIQTFGAEQEREQRAGYCINHNNRYPEP